MKHNKTSNTNNWSCNSKQATLYKLFLLLFIMLTSHFSIAQHNTTSPYTMYGIGDINHKDFGRSQGLGGIGIGLPSYNALNIINPASYGFIKKHSVLFEFGGTYKYSDFKTNKLNHSFHDVNLSYIAMGFPVTKWWSASFGLLPFSSTGYNIMSTSPSVYGTSETEYTGSGGIDQLYFGSAFKPHKSLSIGFNASYLYGPLERETEEIFTGGDFETNMYEKQQLRVSDFYFSTGIQYHKLLSKKYLVTVGAVYEKNADINAYRTEFATQTWSLNIGKESQSYIIDTLRNDTLDEGHFELPSKFGIGGSLQTEKILVGFDYFYQDWSESSFFGTQDSLANSNRFSLGFEYTPNVRSPKYIKNINYRLGLYYSDTYLKINNNQLKEYGASMGLGLPLRNSRSVLNLAFQYIRRGNTENNLIQEDYFIFTLNLTMHDLWFIKRKFD